MRLLASLGAAALLAVAGCGGSDSSSGSPATATTTASATTTPTTTAATTAPPPAPEPGPTRVRLKVVGGEVNGGGPARVEIERGDKVVLLVTADVTDHVHLHGYDIQADVAPGRAARIAFTASIPGRFEVELESRGQEIAQLEVGA